MNTTVNIEGLKKEEVLKALYDNSKPLGMGILHYDPKDMTLEEARNYLKITKDFDYLKGRVIKVNLKSDIEFNAGLYDRDNGLGAAARVIRELREKKQVK